MIRKSLYLPEVTNDCGKILDLNIGCEEKGVYPCPCCDYLTFSVPKEEAIAYICPVCYWENDVFIKSADESSDENHGMTLHQGRSNYKLFGACSQDMLIHVRKPKPEEFAKPSMTTDKP